MTCLCHHGPAGPAQNPWSWLRNCGSPLSEDCSCGVWTRKNQQDQPVILSFFKIKDIFSSGLERDQSCFRGFVVLTALLFLTLSERGCALLEQWFLMMLLAEIPPRMCFVPVEAWFNTVIYYLSSNRGFERNDALLQAFLTSFFCSALILCSVAPDIQKGSLTARCVSWDTGRMRRERGAKQSAGKAAEIPGVTTVSLGWKSRCGVRKWCNCPGRFWLRIVTSVAIGFLLEPQSGFPETTEMRLFTLRLSMGSLNGKDWEAADLIWLLMHKSVLFGAKANVSLGTVPESLAFALFAGQLYSQN